MKKSLERDEVEMQNKSPEAEAEGLALLAALRNAYNEAARGRFLGPDDLASIIASFAYVTMQLTFELEEEDLVRMVASSVLRYIASGAFEANRESDEYTYERTTLQ